MRINSTDATFRMQINLVIAVVLLSLTIGCSSPSPARHSPPPRNPELRSELMAMEDLDQRVREGFSLQTLPEKITEMQAVDAKHTARMKEIVTKYGWPGRSLVGDDGAHAAWLLVQHAEASFMAECLPLMGAGGGRRKRSPKITPISWTECA
jgi:hypothetical protein